MTRLEKFRAQMTEAKIDGFLITQPNNRTYLSGFTGSAGILIITPDRQAIATDFRYYQQVQQECPDWELLEIKTKFTDHMLEWLRTLKLGARRVGFETGHITVATLYGWERALKGRLVLVDTKGFTQTLRMQKDAKELSHIKKAVALADETLLHITTWIEPGMTEQQVAWEIERYMRTNGASALSFEPIVASGPNSAKPHAHPTDRPLQTGEPITLDIGCVIESYCSDLTRTFCLGQPNDDQYLTVWNTVSQAKQAAITGTKAGLTGQAIDKMARDIIIEAGYGDYFGHSLGHAVGLEIHEAPRFSHAYPNEIPTRAVMTIEPGIYIPDWGGVRLEDMVVVQADGVELLTTAPEKAVLE